jgi:APA family basic amino acid/polyamine antiporter
LFAFGLVCFSVIWLRYKRPDLPRPFKVWGFPVIPAVGVLICFWLAWDGATISVRKSFGWFIGAAILVYFAYGFWVSPMRNKAPEAPVTPAS